MRSRQRSDGNCCGDEAKADQGWGSLGGTGLRNIKLNAGHLQGTAAGTSGPTCLVRRLGGPTRLFRRRNWLRKLSSWRGGSTQALSRNDGGNEEGIVRLNSREFEASRFSSSAGNSRNKNCKQSFCLFLSVRGSVFISCLSSRSVGGAERGVRWIWISLTCTFLAKRPQVRVFGYAEPHGSRELRREYCGD